MLSEFEKMAREHDFWHRVSALVVDSELEEGVAMYKGGNLEEAADRFQRVVQLARLTSLDRKKEGRALGNLATVSREMAMRPGAKDQRDMLHEAIFYYRMSCKIFKSHGDRQMVSLSYYDHAVADCEAHTCYPFSDLCHDHNAVSSHVPIVGAGAEDVERIVVVLHGRGAVLRCEEVL